MAFHCYQPVFNFDNEIEKAYKTAYLPFLNILEEFSGIKVSFHYSGNLLQWLNEKHPEYIERIGNLISDERVEIIGGGCFDPIMTIIPERDRTYQLELNKKIVKDIFSVRARGAWLAERVWDMSVADTFAREGVEYTIVDDHHLERAGVKAEKMFRPYHLKTGNSALTLFPSLTKLRYLIPFCKPAEVIDYIKSLDANGYEEDMCLFFADDGEKFGAWPCTYRWVYKKGWLRNFFQLLEKNDEWLRTTTYAEVLDNCRAEEIEKVPPSSYAEMMKWSGGNFNNFFKKYAEAGRMRERMIHVSDMVEEASRKNILESFSAEIKQARKELCKAQSNCAYWHGVFGGAYLPHLRSGVYSHLIKAENIIACSRSAAKNKKTGETLSWNFNSFSRETVLDSDKFRIFIKSSSGGAVSEIDYKPLDLNLTNTITRIKETYHEKLNKNYAERIKAARKSIKDGAFADINDVMGIGRRGLRKNLIYDSYRRMSFLTHIFLDKKPLQKRYQKVESYDSFLNGEYCSSAAIRGETLSGEYTRGDKVFQNDGSVLDVEVNKSITLAASAEIEFSHRVKVKPGSVQIVEYGVEFNFLIWDRCFLLKPKLIKTDGMFLKDQYSKVVLRFFFNRKFPILTYPIYSVNETENGLNKTFQGISLIIGDECGGSSFGKSSGEMKIRIVVEK